MQRLHRFTLIPSVALLSCCLATSALAKQSPQARWLQRSVAISVEQGHSVDVAVGVQLTNVTPPVSLLPSGRLRKLVTLDAADIPAPSGGTETGTVRLDFRTQGNTRLGRLQGTLRIKGANGRVRQAPLYVLLRITPLKAGEPPTNNKPVNIGGAFATTVDTTEYTGAISLPHGIKLKPTTLSVRGGIEHAAQQRPPATPTRKGNFVLRMNTSASAFLAVFDKSDTPILLAVFPKHPFLADVNPTVDVKSTAVALIFTQPGILLPSPLSAAILMRLIAQMPETEALANVLATKMRTDIHIAAHPDAEVAQAISTAVQALEGANLEGMLTASRSAATGVVTASEVNDLCNANMQQNPCDRETPTFRHIGTTDDNVCVDGSFVANDTGSGQLATVNYSGRWLTFYVDREGDSDTGLDAIFNGLVGFTLPRQYALPSIEALLAHVPFDVGQAVLLNLFKSDVLDKVVDALREEVQSWIGPAKGQVSILPMDAGKYELRDYGPGQGGTAHWERVGMPFILTGLTQVALPALAVAADQDSRDVLQAFQFNQIHDLADIARQNNLFEVQDVLQSFEDPASSNVDRAKAIITFIYTLVTDPAFQGWLAQRFGSGDLLAKVATQDLIKALTTTWFGYWDEAVNIVNLALSLTDLWLCVLPVDAFDAYSIDVSSPPSSSGSTGIIPGIVDGHMVDKAYVPIQSEGRIAVINADSINPTGAVITSISIPDGYQPNATAGDPKTQQVVVISYTSPDVQIIDAREDKLLPKRAAPVTDTVMFSGGHCVICGVLIDQDHNVAILDTADGYMSMDLTTGDFSSLGGAAGENFGYNPMTRIVLNPTYWQSVPAGLQALNLADGLTYSYTTDVGSEPDSAAVDVRTNIAVVPDEGTGNQYLINMAGASFDMRGMPPTFAAPSTIFPISTGCGGEEWTLVSIESSTHRLFLGTEFADCAAVEPLPGGGVVGEPPMPTVFQWGHMPTPNDRPWCNGADPHGIAVFTSVVDRKAYGFLVRSDATWVARIDLAQVIGAAVAPDGSSGEVDLSPFVFFLSTGALACTPDQNCGTTSDDCGNTIQCPCVCPPLICEPTTDCGSKNDQCGNTISCPCAKCVCHCDEGDMEINSCLPPQTCADQCPPYDCTAVCVACTGGCAPECANEPPGTCSWTTFW